jgi:hypothetical protein
LLKMLGRHEDALGPQRSSYFHCWKVNIDSVTERALR